MSNSTGPGKQGQGRGGHFKSLVDRRGDGPRLNVILEGSQQHLGEAVHAAVMGGLGVLIAATSDAGAISITLYDGDERFRSYASSADEWKACLEALTDAGDAKAATGYKRMTAQPMGR